MKSMELVRTLMLCLVQVACVTSRAPLYSASAEAQSVTDEYLVVFRRTSSWDRASPRLRLMSALWQAHHDTMEVLQEFTIRNWKAVHIKADDTALDSLRQLPDVLLVETNRKVSIQIDQDVNELDVTDLPSGEGETTSGGNEVTTPGGVNITTESTVSTTRKSEPAQCVRQNSGADLWGLSRINVHQKPSYSRAGYEYSTADDGSGVDIYVVDSGVYEEHSDFQGRASWGMTAAGVMDEGKEDLNGHGTHVAGIAAGATYGVAKKANIIAVKVLNYDGKGTIADVLEGLQWIVNREMNKAQPRKTVVNLSLGTQGIVYTLDAAIQEAVAAGIPFVVAASNDYTEACHYSPARIASVITVGATDQEDKITFFSNYGPCINILAPGEAILSTHLGSPDATAVISGTSQASPHVAGVLARHLSSIVGGVSPTPAQLLTYITDTATSGSIVFEGLWETTTPNLLLYRACSPQHVTGVTPAATIIPPNDSAAMSTTPAMVTVLATLILHQITS